MSAPLVSVCLPVFNGEKFLPLAIQSVLNQTFPDFELIVVDDGSSDRTREIVAEFAGRDQRIRLHVNESNLGLFANYNRCMEHSTGKYIKPFAQDDLWSNSIIARMVKELDARPGVSLVACARNYVDGEGRIFDTKRHHDQDCEIDGKKAAFEMISRIDNVIGEPCAVMFRREQAGKGFEDRLPQMGDLDCWARLLQLGNLFYITDALCTFRVHQGGQTTRLIAGLDYLAEIVTVKELHRELLESGGLSQEQIASDTLAKAVEVTEYATSVLGINYLESDFAGVKRRPREIGLLLVDALKRLAIVEREQSNARSEASFLESENSRLRRELNDLLNSPSWKVTAGLRHVKKLTSSLFESR